MSIRINATILDAIDRVQSLADYIKEIPSHKKTLEYDLDETSAEDVKNILCTNDTTNCHFRENCLMVITPLTAEEVAERVQDRQEAVDYWVMRLVKWCETEEYKMQIGQYLEKYSTKYADVIKMMQEYTN